MEQGIFSPQESRLMDGEYFVLTDKEARRKRERIDKMLGRIVAVPPRVAVERARYLTESFRQTEGLPLSLRYALALKNIAEKIEIFIDPLELIVGRCGQGESCGLIYPELRGGWLNNIASLAGRKSGRFYTTDEDIRVVEEEIIPYWRGRTWHEAYMKMLPEETRRVLWDDEDIYKSVGLINVLTTQDSSWVWALDYDKVLRWGFNGIKQRAEEKLKAIDIFDNDNNYDKKPFYEAVVICCEAISIWAARYAKLAREMAGREQDPSRAAELEKMAEVCAWVPFNPARSFHEAVQAVWFANAFSRFEQIAAGQMGLGRIDRYLYPYYHKDKEAGRLDDDQAMELLEGLWLHLSRIRRLVQSSSIANYQGYPHFEQTQIGGQDENGKDTTNELSYLILRSKKEYPLDYPDLSVRIHALSPTAFLRKVAELVKEGTGFPKLYNDEEIIPLLLAKGAALDEARNYTGCGCAEVRLLNRDTYMTQSSQVNIAAALEMALHDGRMPQVDGGKTVFGLPTGDPRKFQTYDDLWAAYKAQLENLYRHAFINRHTGDMTKPDHIAAPFTSSLHDLCLDQGLDIHQGQGRFEGDLRQGNLFVIGFGTAIDSLAAVKKLVFEDKSLDMAQLLSALEVNFEDQEIIRQMCLNAPKYGNCDDFADLIGRDIDLVLCEHTERYTLWCGGKDNISYVPVTSHVGLGGSVGATPNGRLRGEALSEGVSPTQGSDISGPTATLLSINRTKNSRCLRREARLLNIKLSPSVVEGEKGTQDLVSFIRAWCDQKHWHLQFNIINRDTLIAAQKNPEKYRNLLVRVAGYSAYFCDLSRELQDEIIARTEHR